MAASYEIKRAGNKQFFFNLKAANGEVVLTSEMYKTRTGVNKGIESVTKNGPDCLMYDMKMDKRGRYYFLLKAANNRIIGKSESYTTAAKMEKGIQAVIRSARSAVVRDLSR